MRFLRRRLAEARDPDQSIGPRIAIWGTFDVADYMTLLLPRILERELQARLPLARVDVYSPHGHKRPMSIDGGRPAIPLGSPTARRKRELASRHDLVVVTGDVIHPRDRHYQQLYELTPEQAERLRPSEFFLDGLGPELERRCPVVWSAAGAPFELDGAELPRVRAALEGRPHVSVHDDRSRDRLLATGTAQEIVVVPELTVLASRLFPSDLLRKRIEYLRVLGCYPLEGRPIFVQHEEAGVFAARSDTEAVVVAELQPLRDSASADALPEGLNNAFRLPQHATVEDISAAIANAGLFVGTAESVAVAFGVPSPSHPDPGPRGELQTRLDAELDAIAELAERSWSQRVAEDGHTLEELAQALAQADERYQALTEAHTARGERLVSERIRFAEIVDRLDESNGTLPAEAALRIAELENTVFTAQAAEAEALLDLEQLREARESDA
jgi:hypothetical protein